MTTVANLIFDALAEIGVVGATDTVSAEDYSFCLRKLNQALELLSNTRLAIPATTQIPVPLVGSASYTIGPTGSVVAARPLKVLSATYVDSGGFEGRVDVLTEAEWDAITFKAMTGGPPDCIWYRKTLTNGTVYVYPTSSGYTLNLDCLTKITSFANVNAQLSLPEGYATFLTLRLSDDVASAYSRQTTPDTRRRLAAAAAAIKATNLEPTYLKTGMEVGEEYEIQRGY